MTSKKKRGAFACLVVLAGLGLMYAVSSIWVSSDDKAPASQRISVAVSTDSTGESYTQELRVKTSLRNACDAVGTTDLAGAEKILKSAVVAHPNSEIAQFGFGALLLSAGQTEQWKTRLLKAVEIMAKHNRDDDAHFLRQTLTNAHCNARAEITRYLARKVTASEQYGDWATTELMARLYILLVPHDGYGWRALGGALEMLQRFNEMERAHRRAVALSPSDPHALNGLGAALYFLGRYEEAERYLRESVELAPLDAQLQCDFAASLFAVGRIQESERHCREALRLDPNLGTAHIGLGEILFARGEMKEAEIELRKAVQVDPQKYKTHNALGVFLMRVNRLDEAERAIREALRLQPDSPDVRCNLGALFWKRNQLVEAEREYREAFRIANGLARARFDLAQFLMGGKARHLVQEERFREAEEVHREVLRLTPNWAYAYNDYGNLLIFQSNRWEEAEVLLRKSLEYARTEERPDCSFTLGCLLAKQPVRQAEAVKVFREALAGFLALGKTNWANDVQNILHDLNTQMSYQHLVTDEGR